MKLLFDTDAFCKIGIANLLPDVAQLFGAELQECSRLYALPFMLRKGSLERCMENLPVTDCSLSLTSCP